MQVEIFTSPGCGKCGHAKDQLRELVATLGDASAADGAALDQRDAGAAFDRLQRRRHRATAAADDCNVQRAGIAGCSLVAGRPNGIDERAKRDIGSGGHLRRAQRVGHLNRLDAGHLL